MLKSLSWHPPLFAIAFSVSARITAADPFDIAAFCALRHAFRVAVFPSAAVTVVSQLPARILSWACNAVTALNMRQHSTGRTILFGGFIGAPLNSRLPLRGNRTFRSHAGLHTLRKRCPASTRFQCRLPKFFKPIAQKFPRKLRPYTEGSLDSEQVHGRHGCTALSALPIAHDAQTYAKKMVNIALGPETSSASGGVRRYS